MFLFFSTCPVGAITQITQIILILSDSSDLIPFHLLNPRNLRNHREAVCFFFSTCPVGAINQIPQIILILSDSSVQSFQSIQSIQSAACGVVLLQLIR